MSNNRAEISRNLRELEIEYENLDRFFYSNFKIYSENFTSYIKAKPYASFEYSRKIDFVKEKISYLWRLCNEHTGSWFDSDNKKEQDRKNIEHLVKIEQDINKLISLYRSYKIVE